MFATLGYLLIYLCVYPLSIFAVDAIARGVVVVMAVMLVPIRLGLEPQREDGADKQDGHDNIPKEVGNHGVDTIYRQNSIHNHHSQHPSY